MSEETLRLEPQLQNIIGNHNDCSPVHGFHQIEEKQHCLDLV